MSQHQRSQQQQQQQQQQQPPSQQQGHHYQAQAEPESSDALLAPHSFHGEVGGDGTDSSAAIGTNVTNDLMRVYESMIQSKTPQIPMGSTQLQGGSSAPGPGPAADPHQAALSTQQHKPQHASATHHHQQQSQQHPSNAYHPHTHVHFVAAPATTHTPVAKSNAQQHMSYPVAPPVPTYPPAQHGQDAQHYAPGHHAAVGAQGYLGAPPVAAANAAFLPTITEHHQLVQPAPQQPHPGQPTLIATAHELNPSEQSIASDSSVKVEPNVEESTRTHEATTTAVRASSRRKRSAAALDTNTTQAKANKAASSTATSARSKRGGRKKGKGADGRWSKRFTWPEDLHRDFVSAIFDVGLKHSSPSTILEHMPRHEQITTERIKSHLQKYRLHRAKSKKEFMACYEGSLTKFQSQGLAHVKSIGSGEVAAHAAYSTINEAGLAQDAPESQPPPAEAPAQAPTQVPPQAPPPSPSAQIQDHHQQQIQTQQSHNNHVQPISTLSHGDVTVVTANSSAAPQSPRDKHDSIRDSNDRLMLPKLTDAEKASPMGAAMGYLMGLFFSLKQQLMIHRAAEAANQNAPEFNTPVQAVYSAFVAPPGAAELNTPLQGHLVPATTPTPADSQHQATPHPAQPHVQPAVALHAALPPTQQLATTGNATAASVIASPPAFDANNLVGTKKPAATASISAPSTRTNLEENNLMKRDMQNQMALQNKMRALKQQELNKYRSIPSNHDPQQKQGAPSDGDAANATTSSTTNSKDPTSSSHDQYQGAGPSAAADERVHRPRGLSLGDSDEFWNTDMVDEQLFEFLMND